MRMMDGQSVSGRLWPTRLSNHRIKDRKTSIGNQLRTIQLIILLANSISFFTFIF